MNITLLPGDEKEKRQHINSIHSISRETGISEENVSLLYEEILERYSSDAKIKDYLPILVSREVKEMLLNNDGLVKSRHSRGNGNPEVLQHVEKSGFPLSWE